MRCSCERPSSSAVRLHKRRNVADQLPDRRRGVGGCQAGQGVRSSRSRPRVGATPNALPGKPGQSHPGAAASLREGLDEMFTVARLGIDGRLAKTLTSSNPVESMISIARTTNRNVTRWRDGQMVLPDRGRHAQRRTSAASRATNRCPSSSPPCTDTPSPKPSPAPAPAPAPARAAAVRLMDRHRKSTRIGTRSSWATAAFCTTTTKKSSGRLAT